RDVADRNGGEKIGLALDGGVVCPGLRLAVAAVPPRLSASAMMAPPCRMLKRLLSSSRATSSPVTRSAEIWVILNPRNSANGGCSTAASLNSLIAFGSGHKLTRARNCGARMPRVLVHYNTRRVTAA